MNAYAMVRDVEALLVVWKLARYCCEPKDDRMYAFKMVEKQ